VKILINIILCKQKKVLQTLHPVSNLEVSAVFAIIRKVFLQELKNFPIFLLLFKDKSLLMEIIKIIEKQLLILKGVSLTFLMIRQYKMRTLRALFKKRHFHSNSLKSLIMNNLHNKWHLSFKSHPLKVLMESPKVFLKRNRVLLIRNKKELKMVKRNN
jgi:hypothetical protein